MKLYEIPIEAADIEAQLAENYGELTPELEKQISDFMEGSKDKVEAAAAVVRSLEGDAEVCKMEAKRLMARADGITRGVDRLKQLMLLAVDRGFSGKLKTPKFTIWGQNAANTYAIDLVPGSDLFQLASTEPWCVRQKDPELDKMAIRLAVIEGKTIPEAIFIQEMPGTRYLRIK